MLLSISLFHRFFFFSKAAYFRILLVLTVGAFLATCTSPTDTEPPPVNKTAAELEFTNSEVSPWAQYLILDVPDSLLYNAIDGGAGQYISMGLNETVEQRLWKPDSAGDSLLCRVLIMDFGTSHKAIAMFNTMVAAIPVKKTFSSFPATVAAVNDAPLVGNTTYAHFNQFYFQFDLVNYNDKALALSDAENFVRLMQSKVSH